MDDGYRTSALSRRQQLAIAFADHYLAVDGELPDDLAASLHDEFSGAELAELATGMALFHGFSKLLISLGCEPDSMDTTVLPTPDVPGRH